EKSCAEWVYTRPLWVTTDGTVIPFASNLLNSDELEIFLSERNHIPSTCVLHRRSCLDKYGYWSEVVRFAGDWEYWKRIIEGGKRANFAYCAVPSALHFNAIWKTTPENQMPQVTAARKIGANSPWWPASLKVPLPSGAAEQQVFYELIRSEGYIERLRRDVLHVVERSAWIQLDTTPALFSRQRAEIDQITAELEQARLEL